jgi:PAS domain S-box-containing protein
LAQSDEAGRFEIAAHAASLGVWDWDLTSGKFYYSRRAKEICGFPPDAEVTFEQVRSATHPDDLPRTSALGRRAVDPAVRAHEPYRYRVIRADTGEVRWVLAQGDAVFDGDGPSAAALRYIGTLQDITQQRNAEQALVESEARLRYAIEAGNMAVWEIDLERNTITPSPELNALCGFPLDAKPTLEDIRARYAPGEEERIEQERIALMARGETSIQTTFKQIWPNGTERWLLLRASVAPPSDAIARRVIGVLIDITAQKLAEQQAALIAGEMQHRVKNALAVVQTLAVQSFRNQSDVKAASNAFLGRLQALAAATQSITTDGWSESDLRTVIDAVVQPYRDVQSDPFFIVGVPLRLPRKAATAVALGIHELCTNAVKYGALSVESGRVEIGWVAADDLLTLTWRETGGPAVAVPPAKGFGTTMLQRGLLEPGAVKLLFQSEGVVCTISVPLPADE